jgi:hypothetical protein
VELLVGGFALFLVLAVVGLVLGMLSLVGALIVLPFKLLGFAFKALGALLALPFLLIFGVIGALLFGVVGVVALGAGLLAFFIPLLPFALIAWGVWWLVHRKPATV